MERYHVFKLGLAILFYAAYCIRLVSGLRSTSLVTNQTLRPEDYNVFYQGVDGVPGVDFPVLAFIPRTTFSCDGIDSGYYADLDTDCQVFHICEEGKKISFLCPNGTIFEQADLICEWWYKVNCTNAPNLYQESAEFLREDLARRKALRKRISLDGRERNHGAVMRIEESASVSAQQNGRPLRIGTGRGQVGVDFARSTSSPSRSNLIPSALDKDLQNVPQKRYNDADTGNFINNVNSGSDVPYTGASSISFEKQLYTRSTTPSSFSSNLGEIPSRKQLNNRGSVKYSNGFGSKISESPGSTLKPTTEGYDLAFPTHRSEVTLDFRPKPTSGSNTVKIDSSKVNLGQPKQQSTVGLTRNDILNRRFESADSDELQVPQETAAFSSNSYNSLKTNTRKFTSSPYPNHRPTYSDLKRPDFTSTKLVNPINSVTPQYITTQSINSGKPFVGSTVGGKVFRGTGRTKQSEESVKSFAVTDRIPVSTYQAFESSKLSSPTLQDELSNTQNEVSTTETTVRYTAQPVVSSTLHTSDDLGFSTPRGEFLRAQQNGEAFGTFSTSERAVPYTVQPDISPYNTTDNNQAFPSTTEDDSSVTQQNEEAFGTFSTSERAVQPDISPYNTANNNQGFPSTTEDDSSVTQQNEEAIGSHSTTERGGPYTVQLDVSSTSQPFESNSQGFSSTLQPRVSSTASPSFEDKTTRTVDHATVYGSFSRGPTTVSPPNGVEVKLGKNVDKISIQLSKSLGGEPVTYSSTVGPQLASDGFVRITAGLSQPIAGSVSQSGLRTGSGRGTRPPLYSQSGKEITVGTAAIGSGGVGTVGSTLVPNTLSLSEATTDIPESSTNDGSTLIPSHITPEIHVNNIQSTTGTPGLIETSTGTNLESFANTGTPSPDGSTLKFNVNLAVGYTGNDFEYSGSNREVTPVFSGAGSTSTPNIQASTGSGVTANNVGGIGQPAFDVTGSTVPNLEGSTLSTGLLGYDSDTGSQTNNGGSNNPSSNLVSTRISSSALKNIAGGNGLVTGATGITSVPNIAVGGSANEDLNIKYPSSSVRPNVYISENSRHTVSPPTGGYDYSTVSSVTTGPHSEVTELLPIPDTSGSLRKINGTNSHSNSFRPNFYPTRGKDNKVDIATKPAVVAGSTLEGNSYQSVPSSIKTFASDIQGTVPSSLRTQAVDVSLSQNDIGSTLSPIEDVSTYRSIPIQKSNDNSFQSSLKPGESAATGTGFYVTRNSYLSTTPSPFGLSKATTSGYADSTPLVNVSPNSGEEVTLRSSSGDTLTRSETRYPRPFQKSPNSIDDGSSPTKFDIVTPTYFTYKISSARPFELPKDKATPAPTIPTPFTTARSVQENVDDMINTLKEVIETQDYSSETPRPGLVVPPSAGPQTLHTLAQYFANALDGIVAEKEKETGEELDPESKEKLTSLLTQMTMYRYNELFKGTRTTTEESDNTTIAPTEEELEEGDSNNLVETPELRDLAKNFSLALAGYLNDPVAFRNKLKTFRPTEPTTSSDEVTETGVADEELLNFSDADSKSSFNPQLPTPKAPAPTWGFIVAPKTSEDLDVKNSLNPDLHTADSQSFVPGFNNLAVNTGKSVDKGIVHTQKDVSATHWTASPGVTKLWQSTLSVNPADLNENLDSTRPISHTTEPYVDGTTPSPLDFPQREIHYDLRALPKLTLNSTQVHGILIDFNTTKADDSNRLQRLLKKLNTTEDEFLHRMKEIESNPLTKRLILLLISECGANVTKDLEADPIHSLSELLNSSGSDPEVIDLQESRAANSDIPELVHPSLQQDDQDTRALQLLNSLYSIASKFGK